MKVTALELLEEAFPGTLIETKTYIAARLSPRMQLYVVPADDFAIRVRYRTIPKLPNGGMLKAYVERFNIKVHIPHNKPNVHFEGDRMRDLIAILKDEYTFPVEDIPTKMKKAKEMGDIQKLPGFEKVQSAVKNEAELVLPMRLRVSPERFMRNVKSAYEKYDTGVTNILQFMRSVDKDMQDMKNDEIEKATELLKSIGYTVALN